MLRPHWEGWLWRFSNTGTKWRRFTPTTSKNLTPNQWDFKSKLNEIKIMCEELSAVQTACSFQMQPLDWRSVWSKFCCLSQTYVSSDSDENIWFDTKIQPFQEELRETQRKWFVKKLHWSCLSCSESRVSALVQTWTNIDELSRSQWNLVFSMTKCPPLKKTRITENTLQMLHQRNQ